MLFKRSDHTATVLLNGLVLVAGGSNGTHCLNSAELYDPTTAAWREMSRMQQARCKHTAQLLLTGEVLVMGGRDRSDILATSELYYPENDS